MGAGGRAVQRRWVCPTGARIYPSRPNRAAGSQGDGQALTGDPFFSRRCAVPGTELADGRVHFRAAGGKRAAMLEKKHVRLLEAGTAAYGDMEHALFTSCAHGEVVESDSRFDPSDLPQPRTLELRPSLQGLRTNVRTVLLPMYCPLRPREKGTEFNGGAGPARLTHVTRPPASLGPGGGEAGGERPRRLAPRATSWSGNYHNPGWTNIKLIGDQCRMMRRRDVKRRT